MIEYCRYTPVLCAIISLFIACWNIAKRADTFQGNPTRIQFKTI